MNLDERERVRIGRIGIGGTAGQDVCRAPIAIRPPAFAVSVPDQHQVAAASDDVERVRPASRVNFRVVVPVFWVMEQEYRWRGSCQLLRMQYLPTSLQNIKDGPSDPELLLIRVVPAEPGGVQ